MTLDEAVKKYDKRTWQILTKNINACKGYLFPRNAVINYENTHNIITVDNIIYNFSVYGRVHILKKGKDNRIYHTVMYLNDIKKLKNIAKK